MISYEEVILYLVTGEVITFKQYKLDLHENRKLMFSAQNVLIHAVIPPNSTLTRNQMDEFYGTHLTNEDYLQLAQMNCIRIIIATGVNEYNKVTYKVINFTKDYYNTGLQEISFFNKEVDTKFVPYKKVSNKPKQNSSKPKRIPIKIYK